MSRIDISEIKKVDIPDKCIEDPMNLDPLREITNTIMLNNEMKHWRENQIIENTKRTAEATEKIYDKFDLLDKDLQYILSSIGANFQRLERLGHDEKALLEQIVESIQNSHNKESENKLKEIIKGKSVDVVLNAVLAYVQVMLSKS